MSNQRETLIITYVPMKDIHLVVSHRLENLLDSVWWNKVPCSVQHNSTMPVAGFVRDSCVVDVVMIESPVPIPP